MRIERIEQAERARSAFDVLAAVLMIAALAWFAFATYGCTPPPALPAPVPVPAVDVVAAGGEGYAIVDVGWPSAEEPTRIEYRTQIEMLQTEDDTFACVVLSFGFETSFGTLTVAGAVPGSEPECVDEYGELGGKRPEGPRPF